MSILWCGGEDIDFPNGSASLVTTASGYTTNYARCCIYNDNAGAMLKSTVFPGGAITSCWLRSRIYLSAITGLNGGFVGLGKSETSKGLFVGIGASNGKLALLKFDGSSWTVLASETGVSLAPAVLYFLDMQVISYGAAATVNVYLDSALLITYTGDVTVSGVTDLDSVFTYCIFAAKMAKISEIIVADEDTRTFRLVTNAPSAAGDANAWTGAYTTVDETTLDDTDVVYTNTPDLDVQYNLINTPTGTFTVKACKIAARAAITAGASAATLELGVKSGGSIDVDAGHAVTTAWETQERYMAQNPIGPADWTTASVDAVQLNLQSET